MKTKKILLCVAVLLLIGAGCQIASDTFWPVAKAKQAKIYVGEDPNGIQTLGQAKATRQAVIMKHITTQLDAKHVMEKDKAIYKVAIEQANINIEAALAEKESMIGTVQSPGWLTSMVLGGSGFGLYLAGKTRKRPGDINPQEHQLMVKEEVTKATELLKAGNTT